MLQDVAEADIKPVEEGDDAALVVDSSSKFHVSLPDGAAYFAIVSSAANPNMLQRAVENAATAHACLSRPVSAPVLSPVANGRVKGLSFAVWPFRRALLDSGRAGRFLRFFQYAPRICDWHIDFVSETLRPAAPETYCRNLEVITADTHFSQEIRDAASLATERLRAGDGSPRHCLQHGDFWIGNILMPASGDDAPFFVIDWSGMTQDGYPYIDLCRMLMSVRCSQRFAARQLSVLQSRVGGDKTDMIASVLSSLGHLGRNLEHFPPDRYRGTAEDVFRFANRSWR